jgi:predicted amidophosphoribosyltransferase
MRFQAPLFTYPHNEQRKKKEQKERNNYYYSFNLLNPEGTDHVLLTGDILTCYEHYLEGGVVS